MFSFLVIGDWGNDGNKGQKNVADAMMKTAKINPPDLVLSVGDNFYPSGVDTTTDQHWLKSFEQIYYSKELQCPWYSVLGNHDRRGSIVAESEFKAVDSKWNMPSAYYAHSERLSDNTNIDFFFLDTTSLQEANWFETNETKTQFRWLETQLANSKAQWKIVVGHHPIYSSGQHGSNQKLVENLEPLFEQYGVHAYFCGHDHDLEHVKRKGVNYFVVGSGASIRPTDPAQAVLIGSDFAASELGFAAITISSGEMIVDYISATETKLFRVSIAREIKL